MIVALFAFAIACGMIAAGWGHVAVTRRMHSVFRTTRGQVLTRGLKRTAGERGRRFQLDVTYTYVVEGITYRGEGIRHANYAYHRDHALRELAAIPDAVDVHYDPASPEDAYLFKQTPTLGYVLVTAGAAVVLVLALYGLGSL